MSRAARILAAIERFAAGPRALPFLFAYGAAEALLLPMVGDIPLLLFALLVPGRAGRSFAAFTAGALVGGAVLFGAALLDPVGVQALIERLPGIRSGDFASVRALLADGGLGAFLQFGPGIPVKVDVAVAAELGLSPLTVALGVALNRVSRIAPTLLLAALAGRLAPGLVRRYPALLLVGYSVAWSVVYLVYWGLV